MTQPTDNADTKAIWKLEDDTALPMKTVDNWKEFDKD